MKQEAYPKSGHVTCKEKLNSRQKRLKLDRKRSPFLEIAISVAFLTITLKALPT
jgi:hypothetical protein